MIISEIRLKNVNNPNIFLVTTETGVYEFFGDAIVKFGLSTNVEISEEKFAEALRESEYIICLNRAMEYISSKLKTVKQLKDYLYKKGYKAGVINRVIDKLGEYSVIDDTNFARAYIEANKDKMSVNAMKNKLQEKGVKKDLFNDLLDEVEDVEVCQRMADKFLKNKERSKATIEKLTRHLQYKGFGWDAISKVLQKLRYEE